MPITSLLLAECRAARYRTASGKYPCTLFSACTTRGAAMATMPYDRIDISSDWNELAIFIADDRYRIPNVLDGWAARKAMHQAANTGWTRLSPELEAETWNLINSPAAEVFDSDDDE